MEVVINGENRQVTEGYTIARLLEDMALTGKRVAVEVNLEIIPRSTHAQHVLRSGDRIEIVHAIGGGQESSDRL